jgi:hypothetical protein
MEHPEDRCTCNPAQNAHDTDCPKWDVMVDYTASAGPPLEVKKASLGEKAGMTILFVAVFFPIMVFWIELGAKLLRFLTTKQQ